MSNTNVKIIIEDGRTRRTLTLKNATVVWLDKVLPATKIDLLNDGKGDVDKDPTSYTLKLESHDEMVVRDDVLRSGIEINRNEFAVNPDFIAHMPEVFVTGENLVKDTFPRTSD